MSPRQASGTEGVLNRASDRLAEAGAWGLVGSLAGALGIAALLLALLTALFQLWFHHEAATLAWNALVAVGGIGLAASVVHQVRAAERESRQRTLDDRLHLALEALEGDENRRLSGVLLLAEVAGERKELRGLLDGVFTQLLPRVDESAGEADADEQTATQPMHPYHALILRMCFEGIPAWEPRKLLHVAIAGGTIVGSADVDSEASESTASVDANEETEVKSLSVVGCRFDEVAFEDVDLSRLSFVRSTLTGCTFIGGRSEGIVFDDDTELIACEVADDRTGVPKLLTDLTDDELASNPHWAALRIAAADSKPGAPVGGAAPGG